MKFDWQSIEFDDMMNKTYQLIDDIIFFGIGAVLGAVIGYFAFFS